MTFHLAAVAISFLATIVIAVAVVHGAAVLVRTRSLDRAHSIVADGAISAMNVTVAATLLNALTLTNWNRIAQFAAVYALRTMIKRSLRYVPSTTRRS